MKTIDGTGLYHDAIRRIQQLERYNAELAAQIDRMTPVVDVACECARSVPKRGDWRLHDAVHKYEEEMKQLTEIKSNG